MEYKTFGQLEVGDVIYYLYKVNLEDEYANKKTTYGVKMFQIVSAKETIENGVKVVSIETNQPLSDGGRCADFLADKYAFSAEGLDYYFYADKMYLKMVLDKKRKHAKELWKNFDDLITRVNDYAEEPKIKITKHGSSYEMDGKCLVCGCEFKYKRGNIVYDERPNSDDHLYVRCPECKNKIEINYWRYGHYGMKRVEDDKI